jgi:F-type H+-transporting ATPase subunit alpha
MKSVAGTLRLDLAAYRELEAFAQFGSDLDAATQATLARGARLVKTLNQPQYNPWSAGEQVAILFAATKGHLDDIAVEDVERFNMELRERVQASGLAAEIGAGGKIEEAMEQKLVAAITEFKSAFVPSASE